MYMIYMYIYIYIYTHIHRLLHSRYTEIANLKKTKSQFEQEVAAGLLYVYIYIYIHIYTYMCMYIHLSLSISLSLSIYIYIYIYVYIYEVSAIAGLLAGGQAGGRAVRGDSRAKTARRPGSSASCGKHMVYKPIWKKAFSVTDK